MSTPDDIDVSKSEQSTTRRSRLIAKDANYCKLCGTLIPEDCPLRGQGYCDCVQQFSRHTVKKNTPVAAPVPLSTTTEEKKLQTTPKEPKDLSTVRCFRCYYAGHLAKDCETKICDFCKGTRHTSDQCRKNPENYCTKCNYFGHTAENCKHKVCEVCTKPGHTRDDCWKLMTCGGCGKMGHPTVNCKGVKEPTVKSANNSRNTNVRGTRTNNSQPPEKRVRCWLCKTQNEHDTVDCPKQATLECGECGDVGHHSKFCNSEYIYRR